MHSKNGIEFHPGLLNENEKLEYFVVAAKLDIIGTTRETATSIALHELATISQQKLQHSVLTK